MVTSFGGSNVRGRFTFFEDLKVIPVATYTRDSELTLRHRAIQEFREEHERGVAGQLHLAQWWKEV